jgi:hypothetical protein
MGKLFNAEIMDFNQIKNLLLLQNMKHEYSSKGKKKIAIKIVDVLVEEYFRELRCGGRSMKHPCSNATSILDCYLERQQICWHFAKSQNILREHIKKDWLFYINHSWKP